LTKALAIYQQNGKEEDVRVAEGIAEGIAEVHRNMGHVLQRQKKPKEALSMFQEALDMYIQTFGSDHNEVRMTSAALSAVEKEMVQQKEEMGNAICKTEEAI
jgi:Tfp pilus assembly protein PilF